uniref:SAM-dependent methyltransferase n=1 Tax=Pararhizobium sp. IMCC3301 TaxID=3067904 RepID=UPI002741AEFF|nr:cyclopropane-fatty-acyl-phospholipid synthase family protein [Pararhizobium sp. IMCC3301]
MTEYFNIDSAPTSRLRRPRLSRWLFKGGLGSLILRGTLTLRLPDGAIRRFGQGAPEIAITIRDWRTLRRIAFNPDLAIGEAWMSGTLTVEHGDIYGFLDLCLSNTATAPDYGLRRVQQRLRRLVRPLLMHNPIGKAQKNVAHHYDLSDDLYELFLDPDRQYSCAYYATPEDSLEDAQARKMHHIAAKLRLAPGQKLLDIGSGWGGLGLSLARKADVDVTGVTLSIEQQKFAAARAAREGLSARARFVLRDYREEAGRYDRIVSVGMFEHVGAGHYDEYFAKVAALLKEDGVAMIHTIGSVGQPSAPHPWIRKYIFPGGYIPSLSEIAPAIEKSGLVICDIEVLRLHYAETLKAWRKRFMARRDQVAAIYDERFCRMWEFYLAACEAGFRHNGLVVFQLLLAHRADAVPLTRDYLATAETALERPQSEKEPANARRKSARQAKKPAYSVAAE